MNARQWSLHLPVGLDVLNANQRTHWRVNAHRAKALKTAAYHSVISARVPRLQRCSVALVLRPPTNRRRDVDNLVATLKPLCDGLTDAGLRSLWPTDASPLVGIVPDDTDEYMVKAMPALGPLSGTGHWDMTLTITDLSEVTLP